VQIIAVQLDSQWQDPPSNHARVRALLESANIRPGALIVLPEMFDTGFSMNLEFTAQDETRRSERFLRELAAEHNAAVLGGVVGPIVDGQASNEAVAFAPDGGELVRYRKLQPFTPAGEDVKYGAGDAHQAFEWGGVKIAPFICYDLRFPEVFRPAVLDGAEVIVVIACWPEARSEHWVRLLQARAIENQAFVIGVNRCGADPYLQYDGRSCGFDPHGNPLFEASAAEQVVSLAIEADEARQWREKFPALRDVRSDLIAWKNRG
jgi:predicted amidohydrolase